MKQAHLRKFVNRNHPDAICIQDAHIDSKREPEAKRYVDSLGYQLHFTPADKGWSGCAIFTANSLREQYNVYHADVIPHHVNAITLADKTADTPLSYAINCYFDASNDDRIRIGQFNKLIIKLISYTIGCKFTALRPHTCGTFLLVA